jgi:predicted RND superfamily exporter protein
MYQIGTWMILVTAVLLLVLTLGVSRFAPRLVFPALVITWTLGVIGFFLVCIADFTIANVILAVLFIAAGIAHGIRLKRRAEARHNVPPSDFQNT